MDGTWITWTSALVAVMTASGVLASLVVTMREGRALRRNSEFLAHRDQWWKRWSWVVERAVSADDHDRAAAAIMATALTSRRRTTQDDKYMFAAVRTSMPWMEPRKDDDDLQDE